jgi:putative ABC transport system substrate-binding protein
MRRREFIGGLAGTAVLPVSARAEVGKTVRLGFLRVGGPPSAWIDALRQGLRDLGYIEGSNVTIEFGLASSSAQISEIASELVRRNVDLIVASGTPSVLAAKHVTATIPIVFIAAIDPLATGLVQSLARPGGNVTGLTNTQADITGKQIQLLKEIIAQLTEIAVIVRATSQAKARYIEEAENATRALDVHLQIVPVGDPIDFVQTFSAARGASAVVLTDDAVFTAHRAQIAELALSNRMPCIDEEKPRRVPLRRIKI